MISLKFSNTKYPFYDVNVDKYGTIYYYNKKGKLHRLNGPAVERIDGSKMYYVNGELHRLDGPANVGTNGELEYWVNGKRHRLDGPAIIHSDGEVEYWVNGKHLTKEEFDRLTKHND